MDDIGEGSEGSEGYGKNSDSRKAVRIAVHSFD
jgi:hypothetical protein